MILSIILLRRLSAISDLRQVQVTKGVWLRAHTDIVLQDWLLDEPVERFITVSEPVRLLRGLAGHWLKKSAFTILDLKRWIQCLPSCGCICHALPCECFVTLADKRPQPDELILIRVEMPMSIIYPCVCTRSWNVSDGQIIRKRLCFPMGRWPRFVASLILLIHGFSSMLIAKYHQNWLFTSSKSSEMDCVFQLLLEPFQVNHVPHTLSFFHLAIYCACDGAAGPRFWKLCGCRPGRI